MKAIGTLKYQTKKSQGFTIIEVSLFLALTGLVLAGIIGTFSSISRQRYNDSVQDFAEYLRNIYSQVENVRNNSNSSKPGQSNQAIYGKLVTFNDGNIRSYDVVGAAKISNEAIAAGTMSALGDRGAKVTYQNEQSYSPIWQARIQNRDGGNFSGSLLIVRSPSDSAIHTYYSSSIPSQNSFFNSLNGYNTIPVDFCVDSDDNNGHRRDVRINRDAHNASGVELVPTDTVGSNGEGSVCNN